MSYIVVRVDELMRRVICIRRKDMADELLGTLEETAVLISLSNIIKAGTFLTKLPTPRDEQLLTSNPLNTNAN